MNYVDLSQFPLRQVGVLRGQCKPCTNTRKSEWKRANPERVEALRRYEKEWRARNEVRTRRNHQEGERRARLHPEVKRARARRYRYGIDGKAFDTLLAAQGAACAICRGTGGPWHVDHEHVSGRVRGVLCRTCNIGIGHLRENPDILRSAILYLASGKGRAEP